MELGYPEYKRIHNEPVREQLIVSKSERGRHGKKGNPIEYPKWEVCL